MIDSEMHLECWNHNKYDPDNKYESDVERNLMFLLIESPRFYNKPLEFDLSSLEHLLDHDIFFDFQYRIGGC